MVLSVLAALLITPPVCDVAAWRAALDAHWREYPRAEAADLYKLTHHGIMGSEHAVPDTATVNAWMRREVAGLPAHPEPAGHRAALVQSLPPTGRFVRVHLRPFLARGGHPEQLLQAFVATANGPKGDTAQFACAESAIRTMVPARDTTAILSLFAARRRAGFPAINHSDAYEAAYAPAYRVVAREWLNRLNLTPPR
ncbi:MAG: hypothetical protein WCK74_11955 [Gemmatimonadaceae bacterium]